MHNFEGGTSDRDHLEDVEGDGRKGRGKYLGNMSRIMEMNKIVLQGVWWLVSVSESREKKVGNIKRLIQTRCNDIPDIFQHIFALAHKIGTNIGKHIQDNLQRESHKPHSPPTSVT